MVTGPEIAGLVNDFQTDINKVKNLEDEVVSRKHHEESDSVQKTIKEQVKQLC